MICNVIVGMVIVSLVMIGIMVSYLGLKNVVISGLVMRFSLM